MQGIEVVPNTADPTLSAATDSVSAQVERPAAQGIEAEPTATPAAAAVSASVPEALSPQPGTTPDVPSRATLPEDIPTAQGGVDPTPAVTPTAEALSTSVSEALASQPSDSSTNGATPPATWETTFQSMIDVVNEGGHFTTTAPSATRFTIGVLKRGFLNFARARPDILFSLPEDKIRAVLAADLPYSERKVQPFNLQVQFVLCVPMSQVASNLLLTRHTSLHVPM